MDLRDHLDATVRRVRRRLRLRRALTGAATGALAALTLSLPVVFGLSRVLPRHQALAAGLASTVVLLASGVAVGVGIQLVRRGLQRNEVAQLLDHQLGTHEAWVTAAWLVDDREAPRRAEVLDRLASQLDSPQMHAILAFQRPRHLRWAPLLVALWLGVFLLPTPDLRSPVGPDATETERLADRLDAIEEENEAALPEPLTEELAQLTEELAELDPTHAADRLADVQAQLDAFTDELAPSQDLLDTLEEAAEALAEQPELADALANADLEQAAEQLQDLVDDTRDLDADAKQSLAEQMADAGQQLANSGDPSLSQAGEALRQAGEQLGRQADAQRRGEGASEQGETDARMEQLKEQIRQAQQRGEQLQQDRKALQRAQQTNGALDAARKRLEQQASRNDPERGGERGQDGEGAGERGTGEGSEQGRQGAQGTSGEGSRQGRAVGSTGSAHTWEDEGESNDPTKGFNDEDRNSDRTADASQHIDDFERLYAPDRLRDVDALLAGAGGRIDDEGHIELVPMRRTGSEERSDRKLVALPEDYARAATDAINDETVPPGYRDAIKQYFDQME
jgi:hypothetical protein